MENLFYKIIEKKTHDLIIIYTESQDVFAEIQAMKDCVGRIRDNDEEIQDYMDQQQEDGFIGDYSLELLNWN